MSLILIRGAGDIGTAVGILLYSLGHKIVYTELPRPHTLRWAVAFSEAVYRKTWEVQGIRSRFTSSPKEAREIAEGGEIAVLAPEAKPSPRFGRMCSWMPAWPKRTWAQESRRRRW